jgi:hypothetical protein
MLTEQPRQSQARSHTAFTRKPNLEPSFRSAPKAAIRVTEWRNTQFDAELTFMASAGGWVGQEVFSSSRQLVEQCLRLFQIGGVEALGEPAVDWRQQLARLGAPSLVAPQPRKAHRGAQFERARLLRPCHL